LFHVRSDETNKSSVGNERTNEPNERNHRTTPPTKKKTVHNDSKSLLSLIHYMKTTKHDEIGVRTIAIFIKETKCFLEFSNLFFC
jgi:hypothetical protein